ncbi:MAG: FtsQ-type POTRA domain-containing protein [Clostridia bacterium]|nr:FtsQ-type POTRA domain-containing protein [Clostridia bacterium]
MGSAPSPYAGRRLGAGGRKALALLLLAGLLVAAYLALESPAFAVHSVTVTGLVRLDAHEVASEARIPDGTPLWRISAAEVAARVMADPLVASVQVVKRWPNRLVIRVTERVPVASVALPDGTFAEVDEGGRVVAVDRALSPAWPVVTGGSESLAPRQVISSRRLARALQVAVALRQRPGLDVSEIHAAEDGTVLVYLADGTPVDFGTADEPDRQAAVLAGLVATGIVSGPLAYVSVVDPDAPVVRPAQAGSEALPAAPSR